MTGCELLRTTHIAIGTVGLIAFWTTAALRKGTRQHRRIGRLYMLAMMGIILTAIPLAARAFAAGNDVLGVLLSYLIVVTASAAWIAWRAAHSRLSVQTFVGGPYRPVAWVNGLSAAAVLTVGVMAQVPLLLGMSSIGFYIGFQMLRFSRSTTTDRAWWLKHHYTGIVGSGVATHIAFLNLGFTRLVPSRYVALAHYTAWFGPLVAALAAIWWLDRRYGRSQGAGNSVAAVENKQHAHCV